MAFEWGGTLYPGIDCLHPTIDYVHRDEISEIRNLARLKIRCLSNFTQI